MFFLLSFPSVCLALLCRLSYRLRYYHHVRLLSPEPLVVNKPQSTRVEEPTLLCNQVDSLRAWSRLEVKKGLNFQSLKDPYGRLPKTLANLESASSLFVAPTFHNLACPETDVQFSEYLYSERLENTTGEGR
jgi:hypothetical protein